MVNVPGIIHLKPMVSELVRSTEPFDLISFVYRTPLISKKRMKKNKKLKIIISEKNAQKISWNRSKTFAHTTKDSKACDLSLNNFIEIYMLHA